VVTIAADQLTVVEGDDLSFTLTAEPPPASDLTVTVTWSESGSFLTEPGPLTVTIPTSGTATLRAATDNDSADEPNGEVTVTIVHGSDYEAGTVYSATVTVTDNDVSSTAATPPAPAPAPAKWKCPPGTYCPFVNIDTGVASVREGSPVVFTMTADPVPLSAITVSLEWRYPPARTVGEPPATVTFDAGSSTASFRVLTINNLIEDGDSTLQVVIGRDTISASNAYGLGLHPITTVTIEDDDGEEEEEDGEDDEDEEEDDEAED
jgi:hypothetical protein